MKKHNKKKKFFESIIAPESREERAPETELDMMGLLKKISEQLAFLEKKVDALIAKPAEKSFGGGGSYSGHGSHSNYPRRHDSSGSGDRFRERHFHKAVCAECNKECEVPFKPSGDRPVYCKECFAKRKNDNPSSEGRDSRPARREEPMLRDRHFDKRRQGSGGYKRSGERSGGDRKKPGFRKKRSK